MTRRLAVVVLLSSTLLLAVSCDDGDDAPTVTLVTHDSFFVPDDVFEAFTADTGIEVDLVPAGDAGSAVNQAILTKDDPIGDAFFGVDTTFLTRALDEGIFAEYRSPALSEVDDEFVVDPRVTPVDYGDVCVNYDRAAFGDVPPPETLPDLAEPEYADQLVVSNPATSSPGLAFLLATIAEFGEEGWADYWEALRDNGVLVVSGWEQSYNEEFSGGPNAGPRPLVVSYASSPPATVDPDADPLPDVAAIGTMLESCFRQVEYVGVLEGAAHPEEARELVDFMLTPTFQEALPLSMYVFPVRASTPLPELFERYAELPEAPYSLPPELITAERERWIEEWTDIVVR